MSRHIETFPLLWATKMCIHCVHCRTMKDVGLRIRVQRDLREQFLEACRTQDRPAAQIIREFMRDYVAQHEPKLPGHGAGRRNRLKSVPGGGR